MITSSVGESFVLKYLVHEARLRMRAYQNNFLQVKKVLVPKRNAPIELLKKVAK
jgi:hypothetical protein